MLTPIVQLPDSLAGVPMDVGASFGAWLKHRRKTLDLTQEALAGKVGCSVSTIQKIEADERRPSRQIAELLAQHLAIPSAERAIFLKVARGELRVDRLAEATPTIASTPSATSPPPVSNLPIPTTSLIGREAELAVLARLLGDPQCRLLTLVGPGGIGKTRLAIAAAAASRELFSSGVCWIPLAALSAPEFIVSALGNALSLPAYTSDDPQQQILDYMYGKSMLLVFDNVEHLLSDVGLLVKILERAPAVKLLVTSREMLNLRGEWVFDVQGLPVPSSDVGDGESAGSSAVALFVQRARQLHTNFELSVETWPWVAQICQSVEGLPLGIELAAAWIRSLSVREIAQEIERDLSFLSASTRDLPERHRSMQAVFDQSWRLLPEEERRALRRLSVFRGGFQREAAASVAGASLPVLSALIGKSLVQRVETERYDLHELVRQYARERLVESGEFEAAGNNHMRFFLELIEAAEPQLRGSEQLAWLDRLEKDSDNLRAALEWSLRHQEPEHETSLEARQQATQASLRFVGALYLFWKRRARWSEGRDWLKRALAPPADLALARARVKALNAAVLLASDQADTGAAYQLAEENLALSRQLGDSHSIARSLNSLGFLLWKKKDFAGARASCEEALRAFRELGDRFAAADALHNLSHIAINKNDYAAAQLYCGEAAEIYRELGDDIGFDDALGDLGLLAYLQNDFPRAQVLLEESLTHFRAAASVPGIVSALNRLGDVARCEGNYDLADKLYSESLTLYRDMGDKDEFPGLLHNQAYVAQHRGDYAHALSLFKEALEIQRETTNQAGIAECLAGIAGVWIAQGKAQHGARLLAMVEALRDAIGASVWPANRIEYDRNLALLHQSLNEATLAAAWAIGRAMTMDQAIAYALTETGEEI